MKNILFIILTALSLTANGLTEQEIAIHRGKSKKILSECLSHLDRTSEQTKSGEQIRTSLNIYLNQLTGEDAIQRKKLSGVSHVNVDDTKAVIIFHRDQINVKKDTLFRNDERALIEKYIQRWQAQQTSDSKYKFVIRFTDECEAPPLKGWK